MRKKETDSPERGKTLAPSLIKKLDETILMTKNIKSHLSKCVIELSGMLREKRAIKAGAARIGDGKDVDHVRPLSKGGSNSKRNTRVVSKSSNRARK
jgi:hypothetical protein